MIFITCLNLVEHPPADTLLPTRWYQLPWGFFIGVEYIPVVFELLTDKHTEVEEWTFDHILGRLLNRVLIHLFIHACRNTAEPSLRANDRTLALLWETHVLIMGVAT